MRPALALAALALLGCPTPKTDPPKPTWAPGTTYRTPREANARGLLDRKGLIHAHSIYSHDACDGQPRDGGVYDQACAEDFRRGVCQTKHDFVFLTDHPGSFTENEYPDVLQYHAEKGDRLLDHGAGPTANWLTCPDGAPPALVMAGTESSTMMPVGLEAHAADCGATYGSDTAYALEQVRAKGAVTLVAHTEGWSADQLVNLPLDGFEMYNLHANTFKNAGVVLDYMLKVENQQFDGLPDPNVFLAAFQLEDPNYLDTWGTVLSRGVKRVTTMATDCHRNSLPQITQDGERIDSYRRMMLAFSNHLLVRPKADGTWDDRDLKDALRAGRLYGAFDSFGAPVGFDFVGTAGGATKEMGEELSLAQAPVLSATLPTIEESTRPASSPP